MTCEKLQEQLATKCTALPADKERQQLDQLIIELVDNCPGERVTHTSRILHAEQDEDVIPEFLRRHPTASKLLEEHDLVETATVCEGVSGLRGIR